METVIIFSSVRWNFLFQRHQISALSLSKNYKVTFVEPPIRSFTHLIKAILKFSRKGESSASSINSSGTNIRIIKRGFLNFAGSNDNQIIKKIQKTERVKMVIFYIPSNHMVKIIKNNPKRFFIYDRILDWKNVDKSWYPPVNSELNEKIIHQMPNCKVITDSDTYLNASKVNFGNLTKVIPTPTIEEFRAINGNPSGPLGYYGNLRENEIDIELIEILAKHHAVHVVGLYSEKTRLRLQPLGVKFTESVPPQALPSIIKTWSKIIMPYKVLKRSSTFVPDKLWSASATKLPIIASGIDLPLAYRDRVQFAKKRAEFISLCSMNYMDAQPILFEQSDFVDAIISLFEQTGAESE